MGKTARSLTRMVDLTRAGGSHREEIAQHGGTWQLGAEGRHLVAPTTSPGEVGESLATCGHSRDVANPGGLSGLQDDEERELIFLIVHALQNTELKDVAELLSQRALERGLLPCRTDYTGHQWQAHSYGDVVERFDHVPQTYLLDALRSLRRERALLENQSVQEEGPGVVRVEAEKNDVRNVSSAHVSIPSSLLDRMVLGKDNVLYKRELDRKPGAWLHAMPSMHHGLKGENILMYDELRRCGLMREMRDGTGVGLEKRQMWNHQFTVRGHSMAAYCVIYDRTGDLIITGSDDRLVKIWSARTGLLLRCCRGHLHEVSDLAVSHDNKVLASASVDGSIRLWNIDRNENFSEDFGRLVGVLEGHTSLVSSLNFSPVRDFELLSSSFDGTCRIWDIRDGSFVSMEWNWRRKGTNLPVSMNLRQRENPVERGLRPRARNHAQEEEEEAEASEIQEEGEEDDTKVSIAMFSGDGNHIIAGVANCNMCLWEWHPDGQDGDGTPVATRVELLRGYHNSDVYLVQRSYGGDWIASASRDGIVCVWKPGKGGHHRRLVPIDTWKCVGTFSAPEQDDDARARRRRAEPPRVDQIAWNSDDTLILASVQNYKVLVYSLPKGQVVTELSGVHKEPVHVVLAHPFEPDIAITASYSGEIVLWNISRGVPIKIFHSVDSRPDGRKWPDPIAYVDGYISPDGQYAALTDAAGQLHVIGLGSPDPWISRAPYDQFLSTDYEELLTDDQGIVRSLVTNEPADARTGTELVCDATATPYPHGYQLAYRNGTLLSSDGRDVAWIQPGQQPGYVMAAPTLAAAQWRVYAAGGTDNAAEQALHRAQLRLQDHERQIDMSEGGRPPLARENVLVNEPRPDRLWETISASDTSDDENTETRRNGARRPVRQSRRISARNSDHEDDDIIDITELTEEQLRERQQQERERRLQRREAARNRRRQGTRVSTRTSRRNTTIPEEEFDSEPESSDVSSLVPEEEDVPGPSRPQGRRRGRKRERDSDEAPPAPEPRNMSHYQWLISDKRFSAIYAPQNGDEVIYLRQGHESMLQEVATEIAPPWESFRNGNRIRPAEPCVVKSIRYFIASDGTQGTAVTLTLEFSDQTSPLFGQAFDINLYSPLSGLADCVVLRTVFDATVSRQWNANEECKTVFWADDSEEWWNGTVLEDKLEDFHTPQDPYAEANELWERFGVQWIPNQSGDQAEFSYHSPWELRSEENMSSGVLDPHTIDPAVLSKMREAVTAASSQPEWEIFQIAPLVDEAYMSRRGHCEYYNTLIPLPIGLADIASRLENRYYRQPSAIEHDIRLLARNAGEFNGDENDIYREAKKLEAFLLDVLDGTADVGDAEVYTGDDHQTPPARATRRTSQRSRSQVRIPPQRRRRTRQTTVELSESSSEEEDEDMSFMSEEEPDESSSDEAESSASEDSMPRRTRGTRIRLRR